MDPGEHPARKATISSLRKALRRHKSNPVIENMVHFPAKHCPFAKEFENWRHVPGIPTYERLAGARQNPLGIVVETTPGDMGHPMNPVLAQKMQNGFDIDVGGFEKFLGNGSVQLRNEAIGFQAQFVEDDAPRKAVPV